MATSKASALRGISLAGALDHEFVLATVRVNLEDNDATKGNPAWSTTIPTPGA